MEQKYHRSRSFLGVTRRKSIWFIPQPLPFFFCWISHPLLKLRVYDDGTKISSQPFISNCHAYGVDLIHPSHCLSCVFTTIELKYHPSRSFSNCYASGLGWKWVNRYCAAAFFYSFSIVIQAVLLIFFLLIFIFNTFYLRRMPVILISSFIRLSKCYS